MNDVKGYARNGTGLHIGITDSGGRACKKKKRRTIKVVKEEKNNVLCTRKIRSLTRKGNGENFVAKGRREPSFFKQTIFG